MDANFPVDLQNNTYDQYVDEYVAMLQRWDAEGYSLYHTLVIPKMLQFMGDVNGQAILDAGCGVGHVSRLLAKLGANVTGVDIAPRMVERAKAQNKSESVRYFVHDLSKGFPDKGQSFDLIVSNLVINDVYDYIGYIHTLGEVINPGGRLVLSMNNPYSAVLREKARSYYDTGTATLSQGLSKAGVRVYHFHRTFEDYMKAFRDAGFMLRDLSDLGATSEVPPNVTIETRIPFIIVLEFVKSKGTNDGAEAYQRQ